MKLQKYWLGLKKNENWTPYNLYVDGWGFTTNFWGGFVGVGFFASNSVSLVGNCARYDVIFLQLVSKIKEGT